MNELDDPSLLALDASGMFAHIRELGTELIRAWESSEELELSDKARRPNAVVVAGMGGSATAGDYFATLCATAGETPVSVVRGYALPNYVCERTLVIVASYSGDTEETLACYDDAWKRGAELLAITTGGQLAERATGDGVPVHRITYKASPRAAIAHSLAPLLRVGHLLDLTGVDGARIKEAGERHREFVETDLVPSSPTSRNGTKQLAQKLHGRFALLLGAEHLAPVAWRFKNQLGENGKALAGADALPEADHNVIVGLTTGASAAPTLTAVSLESPLYDPRLVMRCDATAQQFKQFGVPMERIQTGGQSLLDDLLQGTAWGDYTSCYLGLLNGVDPTPIPQIDALKAALAG
jgi:glucose/mannose-6-phosphate isomerase